MLNLTKIEKNYHTKSLYDAAGVIKASCVLFYVCLEGVESEDMCLLTAPC